MSRLLAKLSKKILGLALIFNSLLCLITVGNILAGHYAATPWWRPYSPYLIDGSLFWIAILTAILNIVPAKIIGRVQIRRLLFHHYVYGFAVMIVGSIFLFPSFIPPSLIASSSSLFNVERIGLQGMMLYTNLFFFYGGLTLLLDDFADISSSIKRALDWLGDKVHRSGRPIQFIHFFSSLITVYISISVLLWFISRYQWILQWPMWFLAHVVFIASLLINALWGLDVTRKKRWFQTRRIYSSLIHKR